MMAIIGEKSHCLIDDNKFYYIADEKDKTIIRESLLWPNSSLFRLASCVSSMKDLHSNEN